MKIGLHLRELRKKKNLTAKDIADATGVEVPTVTRWENGSINIPSSKIEQYLELLEIPIDTLFENAHEIIDHAEKLDLNEEQKQILDKFKTSTDDNKDEKIQELLQKFKSLSAENQEALDKIMNSIIAPRR
ncbi:helix-turn-helix domain-containing protein [Sporomusa termitida]|uniref:Helix-turn-helix protein n=1 Tax=Sporomusa termitida TaxID=2377 RepID=A0A517DSB2_9FIRM|nr:helix-turn-helix domain-containing protein [Sporomusa termitida]QDR80197.1 helix-turn-helix protein [Sporomusa termitida]